MDAVFSVSFTCWIICMVDLFFIKFFDYREKEWCIETPQWAVVLTVLVFLISASILFISFIIIVWR